MTPVDVSLTAEESAAIRALRRLAKKWPRTLTLFSWSGSLKVLKPGARRTYEESDVATITGIVNDGGDPFSFEECPDPNGGSHAR